MESWVFVTIGSSQVKSSISLITLRPRQNGRHFADDVFKCIFLNENVWTSLKISLKFLPKGPINNIPSLVQIMAWRRPGDKPLSEPMVVRLLTHICVTRLQWVKATGPYRRNNTCTNDYNKTTLYQNKPKPTWTLFQIHIFTRKPDGFTIIWA